MAVLAALANAALTVGVAAQVAIAPIDADIGGPPFAAGNDAGGAVGVADLSRRTIVVAHSKP